MNRKFETDPELRPNTLMSRVEQSIRLHTKTYDQTLFIVLFKSKLFVRIFFYQI